MIKSHYFEIVGFFVPQPQSILYFCKKNMKNYLFLGMMGAVVFFNSCSSNDDNSGQKLLLSKVTTAYYDNTSTPTPEEMILEYNDKGEVIKIKTTYNTSAFEYSNGKLVKSSHYNKEQQLEYYSVSSYNGDQLANVQYNYMNSINNSSVTYGYDSNGKIIHSTHCESPDCKEPTTSSLAYNGDNITVETNNFWESNTYKREFTYDNKLNPYTNVNKYLRIIIGGAYGISMNNYITEKITHKSKNGDWSNNQNITYSIQYNSSQLPVQVIGTEANGKKYVQYNYEYITQ